MPKVSMNDGGTFLCSEGDSVLSGALRSGLSFPYSCASGTCGTCRFTLVAGEVSNRRVDPPAWTERDRMRNRWLGCQAIPLVDITISVRLDRGPLRLKPVLRQGQLESIVALTPDMSEFVFSVEGDDRFLPGQFALLHLNGLGIPRAYSMSNTSGRGVWEFVIKRIPNGAASDILFDHMRPGDLVTIDGPYGNAYLRDTSDRDLLLIAGGSGLGPMISIARGLLETSSRIERQIALVYGTQTAADQCRGWLSPLIESFGTRLAFYPTLSEPPPSWTGSVGLVDEVVSKTFRQELPNREIYCAGPPAMINALQRLFQARGVDDNFVHFDEF